MKKGRNKMIEIINKNNKPELVFECHICKTKFITDEWSVEEVDNGYGFMFTMCKQEKPTKRCPSCKLKVYSEKRFVAIEK